MKILSWNLVKYVIKAAIRDRLILSLLIMIFVGASLSIFMGAAAISESDQFALVFAGASLRFAGVIGLVLFVVFHMRRAFETKDVEYLLSRPISRTAFILSHAAAFSLIAIALAFMISVALFIVAPGLWSDSHILWAFSLMAEFIMIVNVALFFSMVLQSAAAGVLSVFALYVLARMMGQILGIMTAGSQLADTKVLNFVMQGVSLIVPRLDLMAQTSWLLYGAGDGAGFLFVFWQLLAFSCLVICASLVDLHRRQF